MLARTHITSDWIEVTVTRESDLKTVRRVARWAQRRSLPLKVVVLYKPPSQRTLNRWRSSAPSEFRWRIHGATAAEELARRAEDVATKEGIRPQTDYLQAAI
jgi:hypothetical protein